MVKFVVNGMTITQNWARVGQQCHEGVMGCNTGQGQMHCVPQQHDSLGLGPIRQWMHLYQGKLCWILSVMGKNPVIGQVR